MLSQPVDDRLRSPVFESRAPDGKRIGAYGRDDRFEQVRDRTDHCSFISDLEEVPRLGNGLIEHSIKYA